MDLTEHSIASSTGEYLRKAWYLPSQTSAHRLCVFLDGEFYVNRMDASALICGLQDEGLIPPVSCIFVSHLDSGARHSDYLCNASYARYIAQDIVSWLRVRNASAPAEGHFLGGASLSALEAAYVSLCNPKLFSATLCQSGSFWWNGEWLKSNAQSFFAEPGRYWISVGDKETSSGISHPPSGIRQDVDQISAAENFSQSLRALACEVRFNLFNGGHNTASWKDELPEALPWLLSSDTARFSPTRS